MICDNSIIGHFDTNAETMAFFTRPGLLTQAERAAQHGMNGNDNFTRTSQHFLSKKTTK